ncbi:membrane protein insertase YidC [Streptococcus plurextorum]|uniref:membrane protein insertase YidC n=1 Tax=Streptococcus plurextorum TaxID=456876 RepID=UPI000409F501|nr:membrane protein insertase YidC [Streptococcus plurextorum]
MTKQFKRLALSGLSISLLLLLSGCVQRDKTTGEPTGFIWDLLGQPMANLISFFAENLGLGFGIGIILVTIIVRLVILPLGLSQSSKAAYQAEKRAYLAPILEPLQNRMKDPNLTQEEKMAAQADLFAAQKENGVSMFGGIGCLPLLIQMPFFSAMYFASIHTPGIADSTFLWMNLGKPDFILIAIIVALYFVQSWLSIQAVPEDQRQQMKATMYTMPIMMAVFTISLPSSVGLYWLVGGFFSIFQQLITTYMIKPRLREKVAEEFKLNPPKKFKATSARKDVTPSQPQATLAKTNRNAGKQKKRK